MAIIILEGVLFAALVAAIVTLLFFLVMHWTPLGVRLRQAQNRRRIERSAELVCPAHGPHAERDLVRLASGERICADVVTRTQRLLQQRLAHYGMEVRQFTVNEAGRPRPSWRRSTRKK